MLAGLTCGSEFAAVLCGARTMALSECLERASAAAGGRMSAVQHAALPARVTVTCPSEDLLAEAALRAGIPLYQDAGVRMLACTPSIRDWPRTPCSMVEGRVDVVRRFSRSRMRWVASTLAEAAGAPTGFFRIKRDWDWVSLIKSGPADASLIDDRAGRLAMAAKCKVMRWTPGDGLLTLPAQLYPPGIMARGLTLFSGQLPSFDRESRQITFAGVRQRHLRLILALTGLRLV